MGEQKNERHDAWVKRSKEEFCPMHPNISPDNEGDIKWKRGWVVNPTPGEKTRKTFKYCPKCLYSVLD